MMNLDGIKRLAKNVADLISNNKIKAASVGVAASLLSGAGIYYASSDKSSKPVQFTNTGTAVTSQPASAATGTELEKRLLNSSSPDLEEDGYYSANMTLFPTGANCKSFKILRTQLDMIDLGDYAEKLKAGQKIQTSKVTLPVMSADKNLERYRHTLAIDFSKAKQVADDGKGNKTWTLSGEWSRSASEGRATMNKPQAPTSPLAAGCDKGTWVIKTNTDLEKIIAKRRVP